MLRLGERHWPGHLLHVVRVMVSLLCTSVPIFFPALVPQRKCVVALKRSPSLNFHSKKRSPTMPPAGGRGRVTARKPKSNEATTTVQHNEYEGVRAQRLAENAQTLRALQLEGGMIQEPAKEARKRSESMRRGALAACLVRISTACMCRKTPDPSPTTEPPRRSGRRTTALQPEESAELTATSGSAQTALKIYKLEQYLLNGTPFTTSVPCAVTNQNAAIGVFVCTRGNQIVVDFGTHTYSFSKSAAERGRVTDPDEAARLHALWLSNKVDGAEQGANAEPDPDDADADSRSNEPNDSLGDSGRGAQQTQRRRAGESRPSGLCCR